MAGYSTKPHIECDIRLDIIQNGRYPVYPWCGATPTDGVLPDGNDKLGESVLQRRNIVLHTLLLLRRNISSFKQKFKSRQEELSWDSAVKRDTELGRFCPPPSTSLPQK